MREAAESGNEIAVVGAAGRFPGAGSVAELWRNVVAGVESVTRFSDEQLRAAGVAPALIADPHYVKAGAILDGVDQFDAGFFGFPPREAETMDPQHRLFLECAWEALEDAGCDPETFRGLIGVFAGSGFCRYLLQNLATNAEVMRGLGDLQIAVGNERDALPTMVSYKLNLRGPSLAVQTFCSTSLVAVHLAAQSLLNFECDAALAGGVAIDLPQEKGYLFTPGGILSPDGRCRSFDARAEGSIMGNGVALVVLKRLEDALAQGDSVRAVIKGSAVNNDGIRRVGYTAPGLDGQAAVVVEALASAGVDPATVGYVETHGTATPLGDSVEIAALCKAFQGVRARRSCAIGSVKTNIGHLDRAAGVTGLIKASLALESRLLPPSLHYESPNPELGLDDSPFYVNTAATPWEGNGGPRRAGVSSFGVGGTNAHVILEEAPPLPPTSPSRPWQLLVLSAKSARALDDATARLAAHLRGEAGAALPLAAIADVAWTLQTGRTAFSHRRVLVATGAADAAEALERVDPRRVFSSFEERRERPVTFLFPGLGDHYPGMARGLYDAEPVFREQVDLCADLFASELGLDLREVLWPAAPAAPAAGGPEIDLRRMLRRAPADPAADPAAERLQQTWLAQPAVFVVELALARLLMSWGIVPQAMIGYSLGEYVAACLAGVFALEDALRLVARRARLIQELPAGAMLGVSLPEEGLRPHLTPELSLAAVNGPAFSVAAGPVAAVDELERRLAAAGVACRRLPTTHAFHSSMMEPIAGRFREMVAATRREAPRRPWISNLTGGWIEPGQAADPDYWVRHLCETVRFADGLAALAAEPGRALLEVGPGLSLGSIARQQDGRLADAVILPVLRSAFERGEDVPYLLGAVGKLWLAGVRPDWAGMARGEARRRVSLPTYPFQRRRYWVEPGTGGFLGIGAAVSGKKADPADWFYLPAWKPAPRPAPAEDLTGDWLAFVPAGDGLAGRLVERLRRGGARVIAVRPGGGFRQTGEDDFTVAPRALADYERLLRETGAPRRIVHLWSVEAGERGFEEEIAAAPTSAIRCASPWCRAASSASPAPRRSLRRGRPWPAPAASSRRSI
jgi:acyl transferase domain-containing protein